MSSFTISAPGGTDIWKKPPTWNVWNVPTHSTPINPVAAFRSARLTFNATWTEQYDQAGLLFALRPRGTDPSAPGQKWIKTGLEFYNGTPQLSTVACDRYADWSVTPLAAVGSTTDPISLLVERDESELGVSIWVYYLPPGSGEKVPLREVCWFYAEEGGEWDCEVAAFAARPEAKAKDELKVEFSGLDVQWA